MLELQLRIRQCTRDAHLTLESSSPTRLKRKIPVSDIEVNKERLCNTMEANLEFVKSVEL